MGMIRSCDRNRIDVVAIEQPAIIGYLIQLAFVLFVKVFCRLAEHFGIAIAECDQLVLEPIDVALAATVKTDDRHADLAIDIGPRAQRQHAASRCGSSRLFQKGTTRLPGHWTAPIEKVSASRHCNNERGSRNGLGIMLETEARSISGARKWPKVMRRHF